MKLGIKVGPRDSSITDLIQAQPQFCEVWFNINNLANYNKLFNYIKTQKIATGLHFWGATKNNYLANLAYPDKQIYQESLTLVKQTIDTAAHNGFTYVNIHPGSLILSYVNFNIYPFEFKPTTQSVSTNIARTTLHKSLTELAIYAKQHQVKLYLESVPRYAYSPGHNGKTDRINYQDLSEISLNLVKQMLDIDNLYFTNDFGHTLGNCLSTDKTTLFEFLLAKSQELLPKTKLLHVGYIIKPYNGTDYHGCLYYDEINSPDTIPNSQQMIQLLKIYKDQDIWALAEPEKEHVRNFTALKKLHSLSLK